MLLQVSLERKNANITYDSSLTTPEDLRAAIDDMGFDATLDDSSIELACLIRVDGMTCMSCVRNIEGETLKSSVLAVYLYFSVCIVFLWVRVSSTKQFGIKFEISHNL